MLTLYDRRLASGPTHSDELKVYQRLNTPAARCDLRNHTLPVLDYFSFNGLVFVVLPRWGADAFSIRDPFKSISEMFDIAEVFFEGLEFLHEKRIAHGDIAENNVVINKIGRYELKIPNTRAPDVVKYAFIDFDASVIFPEDTDVTKVRVPRGDRLPLHALGLLPGELCNPFEEDVKCLTNTLQEWTRVSLFISSQRQRL
ncbi:hypothetical protein H1R20_g12738, partial [Candolleomyces eurysporus]